MSGKNPQAGKTRSGSSAAGNQYVSQPVSCLGAAPDGDRIWRASVLIDDGESPLAWLARRRGRDGRSYIEPHQLQASKRLRADFTRANLMLRTTSNWARPMSSDRRGSNRAGDFTESMVAARHRVHQALDTVGPEFAGLLLDVSCFLKGLEDVERERTWPTRSAKVVLQLALDRLARHYSYAAQTSGRACVPVRTWLADNAVPEVDGNQGVDSQTGSIENQS